MNTLLLIVQFAATLGCGLMAGVFFIFSNTMMAALAKLEPASGMAAMQSIDRTILNPLFLTIFTGSALLCALVFVTSFGRGSSTLFFIIGSLLYIAGTFLVTMLINVPMNNALDAASPTSPEGRELWSRYLTNWTNWNHVRTVASFLATALLTVGLYLQAQR
jgi:uncharacterized membrane protein